MNTPDEQQRIASEFVDAILDGGHMAGKAAPHRVIEQPPAPPAPNNGIFWIGLVASVLVAVAAQAHALPEPWSHVVSVLGTAGAAVNGYLIRR